VETTKGSCPAGPNFGQGMTEGNWSGKQDMRRKARIHLRSQWRGASELC